MASSPLYVRLRMLVRDAPAADFQFDEITLKNAIVLALRSMYGRVGAAAHAVDLLAIEADEGLALELEGVRSSLAIVCLEESSMVPVRAALTLCSRVNRVECSFEVCGVSSTLLGLACD